MREKPGTTTCVFLDEDTDRCTIYADRPLQCRVQACWDEPLAKELLRETPLTRQAVFAGVDVLLELIEEHDRRCSFERLAQGFRHVAVVSVAASVLTVSSGDGWLGWWTALGFTPLAFWGIVVATAALILLALDRHAAMDLVNRVLTVVLLVLRQ